MDVLLDFALLLPSVVCFNWAAIIFLYDRTCPARKLMSITVLVSGIVFLLNAFRFHGGMDYRVAVWVDILSRFLTLVIFPFLVCTVRSIFDKSLKDWYITLLFAPSVVLGTMLLTVYMFLGMADANALINDWTYLGIGSFHAQHRNATDFLTIAYVVDDVIVAASAMATMGYMLSKRNRCQRVPQYRYVLIYSAIALAAGVMRVLMSFGTIERYPFVAVLLFIAISAGFSGLCYHFDLLCKSLETGMEDVKEEPVQVSGTPAPNLSSVSLVQKFESYMSTDKPYLNPELNIEDVASALGTNRTYISSMINQYYGITFRIYVNLLRIEEAKKILTENPEEKLEEVAEKSGFAGASQLVRKFREIAGEPPKLWVTRQSTGGNSSNS